MPQMGRQTLRQLLRLQMDGKTQRDAEITYGWADTETNAITTDGWADTETDAETTDGWTDRDRH